MPGFESDVACVVCADRDLADTATPSLQLEGLTQKLLAGKR